MGKPVVGFHKGLDHSFPARISRYQKILSHNNIQSIWLSSSDLDFWEQIKDIDLFIYQFGQFDSELQIAKAILPIIEKELHISCFPNQATCWHYDDKIKQYYLFKAYDFPMVDTWIFWDKKSALQWFETAEFPLIFKLKGGAGSANVVLVGKKSEALKLVKRMFAKRGVLSHKIPHMNNLTYLRDIIKLYRLRHYIADKRGRLSPEGKHPYWQIQRNYVLFQRFLPNNTYDTRVNIIGKRAFAFLRYVRPKDFRASGSGLLDYYRNNIDSRCVKMAFELSQRLNFQCMAYDFIFDENNSPKVVEISYTFVDKAVYDCPGYFGENLEWHDGHYWPQFCVLQNLLPDIKLKQPSADIMLG